MIEQDDRDKPRDTWSDPRLTAMMEQIHVALAEAASTPLFPTSEEESRERQILEFAAAVRQLPAGVTLNSVTLNLQVPTP